MREIPILDPVQPAKLTGELVDGPPVVMTDFVFGLLEDPKAVATFAALTKSLRVRDAFQSPHQPDAASRPVARVEQADWEHLCAIAREPTGGYTVRAYACKTFVDAILDAKEAKP